MSTISRMPTPTGFDSSRLFSGTPAYTLTRLGQATHCLIDIYRLIWEDRGKPQYQESFTVEVGEGERFEAGRVGCAGGSSDQHLSESKIEVRAVTVAAPERHVRSIEDRCRSLRGSGTYPRLRTFGLPLVCSANLPPCGLSKHPLQLLETQGALACEAHRSRCSSEGA